jgi:hypothetical protein
MARLLARREELKGLFNVRQKPLDLPCDLIAKCAKYKGPSPPADGICGLTGQPHPVSRDFP